LSIDGFNGGRSDGGFGKAFVVGYQPFRKRPAQIIQLSFWGLVEIGPAVSQHPTAWPLCGE
jgi:hypothetical protein